MKSTLQNKKAWLLFLLPSIAIFIFTVIFPILRSAYFGFFAFYGTDQLQEAFFRFIFQKCFLEQSILSFDKSYRTGWYRLASCPASDKDRPWL